MRSKCYCTSCPNHPKFSQRHSLGNPPTGYRADRYFGDRFEVHEAEVDCLQPVSQAFEDYLLDPTDFDYPITAYGDGEAVTGYTSFYLTIHAGCDNEQYQE